VNSRWPALDAARVFSVGFILAWHGLLAFTHRERGVKADITSDQLEVAAWLLRGFAIKLLFLVAGFLSHQQLQRRGTGPFLVRRLRRLMLPCVLTMWVYNGLLYWRLAVSLEISPLAVLRHYLAQGLYYEILSPMHLWFLFDLAILTLLAGWLDQSLGTQARYQRWYRALQRPWSPLALLLPTTLLLWLHEPQLPLLRYPHLISAERTYPVVSALGVHAVFFLVGWLSHAAAGHWQALIRGWRLLLILAPPLRLGAAAMQLREGSPVLLVHALMAGYWWAIVLGCLGLFSSLVQRPSAWLRYLADSSYWVYLSHLLFMGEMQYLVNGRGWPIIAQYAAVVSGTLALCGLTYHFMVRPFRESTCDTTVANPGGR